MLENLSFRDMFDNLSEKRFSGAAWLSYKLLYVKKSG
jgi:hypothetical protein